MPQKSINGLTIEYDTFGDATAEPVLLIMGLGTQMTAWSPEFCGELAARGHYVVRFDNRDVGLSSKIHGAKAPGILRLQMNRFLRIPLRTPYGLADMANDAAGLLTALDLESAHIVGASMGGMIAQHVAASHPQRVRSLTSIMSSSGARRLPGPRADVFKHLVLRRPKAQTEEAIVEHTMQLLRLISSPGFPRAESEWRVLVQESVRRSFYPEGFPRQLAAIIADGSRVDRLKSISARSLVIHGTADPLVPTECGIDTARHIPNARLELIEGMGHDLPPQLNARLSTLISDHATGA